MIKPFLRRTLRRFSQRYHYDTAYLETLLEHDLRAFLKLGAVQFLSSHRVSIPAAPWHAATIRSTLREDCGPCVQLACNMALEAGVPAGTLRSLLRGDFDSLPADVALSARFAELVLDRSPEAAGVREQVVARWGQDGLVSLGFTISASRVYPTLKYTLGHGHACQRIQIEEESVLPLRSAGEVPA